MLGFRRKLKISGYAQSDRGCLRQTNEDAVVLVDVDKSDTNIDQKLAIVADGMGGHKAGEIASAMACQILQSRKGDLAKRMQVANQQIGQAGKSNTTLQGMGCTCTALLSMGGKVSIAHVGDSRAYLYRRGVLSLLTKDDTLEKVLDLKSAPIGLYAQHILTKALGMPGPLDVQKMRLRLYSGDRLLLCSDGLYNELSKDEITSALAKQRDPKDAVNLLITNALARGGSDNISAIVLNANHIK